MRAETIQGEDKLSPYNRPPFAHHWAGVHLVVSPFAYHGAPVRLATPPCAHHFAGVGLAALTVLPDAKDKTPPDRTFPHLNPPAKRINRISN